MKSMRLDKNGGRTFALVFDEGDEVIERLTGFAVEQNLGAGHFTAIGAFSSAKLGYFDLQTNEYRRISIGEQVEVLTLSGNIARKDDQPKVHAHVALGKSDGTAHGGHLLEARVRPTLELFLSESPGTLERHHDPGTGLALIRL